MGSTTFYKDLKGKPLSNRLNVVLTSKLEVDNLDNNLVLLNMCPLKVIEFLQNTYSDKSIFIIGGESVYKQFIDIATSLYITEFTDPSLIGDRFFPVIDKNIWLCVNCEESNNLLFKKFNRIK